MLVDATVPSSDDQLVTPAQLGDLPRYEEASSSSTFTEEVALAGTTPRIFLGATPNVQDAHADDAANTWTLLNVVRGEVDGKMGDEDNHNKHPAPVAAATQGGMQIEPMDEKKSIGNVADSGESETMEIENARKPVRGVGVAQAVIAAAQKLALTCTVPGVPEAARLIIILVNLLLDRSNIIGAAENTINRCRSVMHLLQRAARVLEEVGVAFCYSVCSGPMSKGWQQTL